MLDDVCAEQKPRAAWAETPAFDLVGIGPEEIAHGAFVGHFLFSVNEPDFIDAVNERGEAAVHAEDGAGSAGGQGALTI
jgi:hypothetical protein